MAFMQKRHPDYSNDDLLYDLGKGCPYCGYDKWRPGPNQPKNRRQLKCGLCGAEWLVDRDTKAGRELTPPTNT